MSKKQNIAKLKQAGRRIANEEMVKIRREYADNFNAIFKKRPKLLPKFIWDFGRSFFINSQKEKIYKYNYK